MRFNPLCLLTACLLAACSQGSAPPKADVQHLVNHVRGEATTIQTIRPAGISDLYEVVAEGNVYYVDQSAKHIFIGRVIERATLRDLTMKRLDEVNTIDFSVLPLRSALKQVRGDGSRILVIFEDPNCRYCKKFRTQELNKLHNVTVYTFLLPMLSEDSAIKARDIWCAPQPVRPREAWGSTGEVPATAAGQCADPTEEIRALGAKLRIRGTPAFYFADGSGVLGAATATVVEKHLAGVEKNGAARSAL